MRMADRNPRSHDLGGRIMLTLPTPKSPEQSMWSRALCLMLIDAIDGPCDITGAADPDGSIEARQTARFKVEVVHEDFVLRCIGAGLDPDAVSQAFRAGKIDRDYLDHAFRALG